jgi:PKD repeat protein
MKLKITILLLLIGSSLWSQQSKNVFFIGNSYTGTGNIPNLIQQIAQSSGDELTYTAHIPGGSTLQQHASNSYVSSTIAQGNWDYVVLQEQSQLPSFPDSQVSNMVFPYAAQLSNQIKQSDACTRIVFYMTWGRKNGDQSNCPNWPPVCTYEGMDNLIYQNYMTMAEDNNGIVSPVGAVWRYLRDNYPALNLYSDDESHPSNFGSMASAYTFFTVFYKKSPYAANYEGSLSSSSVEAIKEAVEAVVFDNLNQWNLLDNVPTADFNFSIADDVVTFTDHSSNTLEYFWDFDDGMTSNEQNPVHQYNDPGVYNVILTTKNCYETHTIEKQIDLTNLATIFFEQTSITIYPNPTSDFIYINSDIIPASLIIFDKKGTRIIPDYNLTNSNLTVNVQNLSNGSYTLLLQTEENIYHFRFIKNSK